MPLNYCQFVIGDVFAEVLCWLILIWAQEHWRRFAQPTVSLLKGRKMFPISLGIKKEAKKCEDEKPCKKSPR